MSILSDKILSYSPEQYIPFNTAYSLSPTNLGSGGTGAWTLSNEAPVLNATGGPDNTGCWQYNIGGNSDTSATRFRVLSSTSATVNPEITDGSFSTGIWFRYTAPLTTTQALSSSMTLFNVASKTQYTTVSISGGSSSNTNRGKLQTASTQTGAVTYSPTRVDDGSWHYLAIRFNETSSGVFDSEIYIDGTLWVTITAKTFTPGTTYLIEAGFLTQLSVTDNIGMMELSNLYITPYSTISSTEISQIYAAGTAPVSTNVSITETPATASALQTEPTIAIVANDHVEITTSILVSADFPSNIVAGADKNVNNEITGTLNASIEMINNVDISTGTDVSFSSTEMTATAELLEAILPVQPLTASATSGDHSVYVTPSYLGLVKSKSPLFYTNLEDSSITNFGSWTGTTYSVGATVSKNQASGGDMGMIAGGESWKFTGTYNNAPNYVRVVPTDANTTLGNLANGDFSVEYWFKPTATGCGVGLTIGNYRIVYTPNTYAGFTNYSSTFANSMAVYVNSVAEWVIPGAGGSSATKKLFAAPTNSIIFNDWNHIVMKTTGTNVSLYINGSYATGGTFTQNNWTAQAVNFNYVSLYSSSYTFYNDEAGLSNAQQLFDEFAIYDTQLTNSEIIDHYSFIYNQDPNRTITVLPNTANAVSGSHNFAVTSEVNYPESPVTASAIAVDPSVIASKVIDIQATPLTASAQNTDVTVYWGWTIVATPATAYSESVNAFRLNDIYYNYVQTNIAPYRYVTFDGNNSYLDYGTDNDYSVAAVTVGGTIVNPDEGINGKSAKTAGTSYITDGVILKESEYDDTWGTGLNNYHSSFWIQKAPQDSSTGLRVVWNLNGYADNQHVILYQYQGKLHLNFNNGSGTHIDQATVGNYDLFDGQRHFIAVAFDHTGANSYVNLFVDAVDVMTVNLGTYNGTTINGTTPVGANDEANNHPRLSIGCLITPFASTALPVVPTNTRIYADEIIWAKSSFTQTLATNLFNIMPDKDNSNFIATPLTASDEFVNPSISTTSILVSTILSAQSEIVDPSIYVEAESINSVSAINVSAEMTDAKRSQDNEIISDVFVATATFNDHGVIITIPGGPMIATVTIPQNITGKVNVYLNTSGDIGTSYTINFNTQKSAYVNYVIKESSISSIARVREIK